MQMVPALVYIDNYDEVLDTVEEVKKSLDVYKRQQQHLILGDVIVLLVSIQNVLIDKIFDTDIVFKSQQWIYIPAVPAFAVIRMKSGPGITKCTKGGYQGRNSILYIGLIYVAPGGQEGDGISG